MKNNDKFILDVKFSKSDTYASNKYNMEKGDHISKYNNYLEVKESFEAGFEAALNMAKTFPSVFKEYLETEQ